MLNLEQARFAAHTLKLFYFSKSELIILVTLDSGNTTMLIINGSKNFKLLTASPESTGVADP